MAKSLACVECQLMGQTNKKICIAIIVVLGILGLWLFLKFMRGAKSVNKTWNKFTESITDKEMASYRNMTN